MYDLSDRELERELRFNIAYKWFCGFTAFEQTPDHSYFGRFREREGTKRIGKVFKAIVNKAKEKQLIRGVFHFVDARSIVTKNTTWGERDKAIKEGEEALNNANVKKYSADPKARFGCKGKSKFNSLWMLLSTTSNVLLPSIPRLFFRAHSAPLGVLCLNLAYSPKILQNLNIKPLFLTLF